MVDALNHIHQDFGISLLDISPGNILMCSGDQFKFGDLGYTRFFGDKDNDLEMNFGTLTYRSPWAIVLQNHFKEKTIKLKDINTSHKDTQGNIILYSSTNLNIQTKRHFYTIELTNKF